MRKEKAKEKQMKRIPVIIVLMLLNLVSYAQVPMPGKPAFMVTYEESGKNGNESWNYKATIKFYFQTGTGLFVGKGLRRRKENCRLILIRQKF